jgi:integrase
MRKVEKLESGRYKVRFRYGVSSRTGRPKQGSETFDRKRDAEQFSVWLDALGAQGALDMLYESEQDKTIPTLDELAADHFRHLPNVTAGTRLSYERLWARTWGERIGPTPVHRLTKDQINLALIELAPRYSHKSLENQRGLLASVVERGVDQGHIPKNIARGVKLPAGKPSRGDEMRILTPDEFATVEEAMDPHFRPLLRFLWGTGCRWGEVVALPVAKVRIPNVSFHQALKWSPDNDRVIGTPKTSKSRRTIVLPPELHDELAALCEGRRGDELVFTAKRGGMIPHRTFWSRYWLPAVEHLTPRPRIHDLRHSHASWLLGNGVPIHVVQARLGHESIQTTVDTYSHLLPDAQLGAANAAALAFNRKAIG